MKSIRPVFLIFCLAALACSTSIALAEHAALPPPQVENSGGETADIRDNPPNLQKEFQAPEHGDAVDIRSYQRKDGATITEYAVRGRVYKIKVKPAGGLPAYYLYDNDGDGKFEQRLPGGGRRIAPPTWVLKEF